MIVECPQCHAKVEWNTNNPFRPFCSDRCKKIDLGAWAEESYIIPGGSPEPDDVPDDQH